MLAQARTTLTARGYSKLTHGRLHAHRSASGWANQLRQALGEDALWGPRVAATELAHQETKADRTISPRQVAQLTDIAPTDLC